MPGTNGVNRTGDPYTDAILSGTKWAANSLSFSFPVASFHYRAGYGHGEPNTGFQALSTNHQVATRGILRLFADVANLSYSEMAETSTQHADLRFAKSDVPSTAWAYYPSAAEEGGDTWFRASGGTYDNPIRGNYAFFTLMHEVGHALGLKHAHEADGAFYAMPLDRDTTEYTVMSYRSYQGASTTRGYTNENWGYAQSLMIYDIAALQQMYGPNYSANNGNTTYRWSRTTGELFINGDGQGVPGGNRVFTTIWDGGGRDTYDFSNYTVKLLVDLRPGSWTRTSDAQLANLGPGKTAAGNIANALLHNGDLRSIIENAIGGSEDDTIIGNSANNVIDGHQGRDTMIGGLGDDTYYVDNSGDVVTEDPNSGVDTVVSSFSGYTLPETLENLTLAFGAGALNGNGNSGENTIIGNESANVIYGGRGADTMIGDRGEDVFYVDSTADIVVEVAGQGTDTVISSCDGFSLSANVEDLILASWAGAINGNGNAGRNTILGNEWANVIYGGDGVDTMIGERGDDIYYVDVGNDVVVETAGQGTDTVIASYDGHTLGANLENLTLAPWAGEISGAGNAGNNTITGNDRSNQLAGGLGDDCFVFNTALTAVLNVDRITDFNDSNDTFVLDHRFFAGLTVGSLTDNQFQIGNRADEYADRIIYNKSTGALLYDADGDLSGQAIHFATLTARPSVSHHDFLIV
jgi:Ca2+-binding RTX toxin-like protein